MLINDKMYDFEFVEKWTTGFEEFAAYVQKFTPEYVSGMTGIAAARIEDLARRIARAEGGPT